MASKGLDPRVRNIRIKTGVVRRYEMYTHIVSFPDLLQGGLGNETNTHTHSRTHMHAHMHTHMHTHSQTHTTHTTYTHSLPGQTLRARFTGDKRNTRGREREREKEGLQTLNRIPLALPECWQSQSDCSSHVILY